MKSINLGLCEGRHEIVTNDGETVEGFIFGEIADPTNPMKIEIQASKKIQEVFELGFNHIDLYITGLSVALIATIKMARANGVDITLWHFDRDSGKYFSQTPW